MIPAQSNFVSQFLNENAGVPVGYADPIGAVVLGLAVFALA